MHFRPFIQDWKPVRSYYDQDSAGPANRFLYLFREVFAPINRIDIEEEFVFGKPVSKSVKDPASVSTAIFPAITNKY